MPPWNNWLHCTGSTYAAWLRGDPRGWRSRQHREHVIGDYKNPPPPRLYARQHRRSQKLMQRDVVQLTHEQRIVACRAWGEALLHYHVELVDLCIGARHWHVLARFTPLDAPLLTEDELKAEARRIIGKVKTWSDRKLRLAGIGVEGGAWAARCKPRPIAGRTHQVQVAHYIREHVEEGAVVWSVLRRENEGREAGGF
jgi:hypothetical protein